MKTHNNLNEMSIGIVDSYPIYVDSKLIFTIDPINSVVGTEGSDTLTGAEANDWLQAGGGDDVLTGEANRDSLDGGAGDDQLDGGTGDDWLDGGAGSDTYLFGSGTDTIFEWNAVDEIGKNKIVLTNLAQADVSFEKIGGVDLKIIVNATGESLYIHNVYNKDAHLNIDSFQFTNATLTLDQVTALSTEVYYGYNVINGTNEVDSLVGKDADDRLDGMAGNDTLNGKAGHDWLLGGDGNDMLQGGADYDYLDGGAGNDQLDGGAGDDWITGGTGNDTFLFGSGLGNDTISEWNNGEQSGNDSVILSNLAQADVSFQKINGTDLKITINATDETLYLNGVYSADSNVAIESFQFTDAILDLAQISALSTNLYYGYHTIKGTDNADVLTGKDGDDWIDAMADDDVLVGGAGNDQLLGGDGNDALQGGDGYNYLHGNAGNDTLEGGAGDDWLAGGLGDDSYLFGSGLGNDTVSGWNTIDEDGNDQVVFNGLAQADVSFQKINGIDLTVTINVTGEIFYIGNAYSSDSNSPVESFQFTDATLDLTQVSALSTEIYYGYRSINGTTDSDILSGKDTDDWIDAGAGDDTLIGNSGNDQLLGGGGNDVLQGGDGNDILNGDADDDQIEGGAGDDWLYGGTGNDTYLFGAGSGNDSIYSWDNVNEGGKDLVILNNLTQADVSFEKIDGLDLRMTINATGETLYIGNAYDLNIAPPVETFQFSDATLNLEQISALSTVVSRMIIGDDNDNALDGGRDDNSIEGRAGNDTLYGGGSGSDWLAGGTGDDTYIFTKGSGYSTISETDKSGAKGNDRVILKDIAQSEVSFEKINSQDLHIILNATGESLYIYNAFNADTDLHVESFEFTDDTLTLDQVSALSKSVDLIYYYDTMQSVKGTVGGTVITPTSENQVIKGSDSNDHFVGASGHDTLMGKKGDDDLKGGAGNDTLSGGAGNDILTGDNGKDYLNGNAGDDQLIGGLGRDILRGGGGNDHLIGNEGGDNLIGGAGADTFYLNTLSNVDRIKDFNVTDDTIQLDHNIFTSLKVGMVRAGMFVSGADVTVAADSNDYLIFNSATGALSYDADGKGSEDAVQIAVLGNSPILSYTDFTVV